MTYVRRRAAMYVAVIMVALIVAVIGVSALTVVRIQLQMTEGGRQVIAARLAAQSAIEMGLFSATADINWRSTYTNDVWVADQALGDLRIAFKYVDELDGDLANDDTQAVRVYGRAVDGEAVRIYSVLTTPPEPGPNLLTNGDMEDGITGWNDFGDCTLGTATDTPHGGAAYMRVKNRFSTSAGPRQYVASDLTNGSTYDSEVWVKTTGLTQTVSLELWAQTTTGWKTFTTQAPVGASWTLVRGRFTTSWTGTLLSSLWKVHTTSSQQDFSVDDAVLRETLNGPALVPVQGTWRREVLP